MTTLSVRVRASTSVDVVSMCFAHHILVWHDAEFFYRTHDPTTVNQQGKDVGTRAF